MVSDPSSCVPAGRYRTGESPKEGSSMSLSERPTRELVAELRDRERLTQEGLARILGVSFSTVNAWEAGRSEPQPRHRRRLEQLSVPVVAPQPDRDGVCVLCVDDSPVDLELLTSLVRDAGSVLGVELEVVGEVDAMGALIALGRLLPTVAFVDVIMPGLDGFELADRIAAMPDVQIGALALVTASHNDEVARNAEQRGLTVLEKPLSLGAVGAVLRRAGVTAQAAEAAR
jgi:CheY-like chemotaxis protein/DNA-binding transcriptional regulator YiaG